MCRFTVFNIPLCLQQLCMDCNDEVINMDENKLQDNDENCIYWFWALWGSNNKEPLTEAQTVSLWPLLSSSCEAWLLLSKTLHKQDIFTYFSLTAACHSVWKPLMLLLQRRLTSAGKQLHVSIVQCWNKPRSRSKVTALVSVRYKVTQ